MTFETDLIPASLRVETARWSERVRECGYFKHTESVCRVLDALADADSWSDFEEDLVALYRQLREGQNAASESSE